MEQVILNLLERIKELEDRIIILEKKLNINNSDDLNNDNIIYQASSRDKTKYMFKGKILPKNRLVFAIVSDYINNNLDMDLKKLQSIFDKSLQGSLQVVEDLNKVLLIKDYSKRYFCNDKEILSLNNGQKVAICTQWGIFNIKKFILVAQQLGYEINAI